MRDTNREFFSELILIVAGFILAETIVKRYLELTGGIISWWVLPLIAIVLIFMAIGIRKGEKDKLSNYYFWVMILLLILFVGLFEREIINGFDYMRLTLIAIVLYFIIFLLELILKKRNDKRRKARKN